MPAAKDITRRAAIGTLAAGGVGLAVWPYRPRGLQDIPSGRKVITYWEKWTGVEGQAIQGVVDRFNESQDSIWVRRVPVSDIESKAMVAIGGGDAPDVVGLFSYNIPQFAESGAAMPFEDFGGLPADTYTPAVQSLLRYEGKQWAGVNTAYTMALYYNRRAFREAGLDPDRPPRTIAELDEYAERLTVRSDDGTVRRAGFLQNIPKWWPYIWPLMFGGPLYDRDSNTATLLDPRTIAAYEWVGETMARYGRDAIRVFSTTFDRSYHSPQDPFFSGRVAMVVQGPWLANFIREFAPDFDYGCGPMPVTADLLDESRPTGLLECDVLMIPRGCPDPEAAWTFVKFMQTQEVQETLAQAHCKPSPMRQVGDDFLTNHHNRYVDVHERIARSPAVQVVPQTRVWPQYRALMVGAFDAVWGGGDAGDALESVQTRVQDLLDVAAHRRRQREGAT